MSSVALALDDPGAIARLTDGELVPIGELTDEELAAALGKAKSIDEKLKAKKDDLAIETIRRMDRRARWTLEAAGVRLEGGSPATAVDYSPEGLKAELDRLVEAGKISEEARDAAVELETPEPKLKVRKKGVQALEKLGDDDVAAAIRNATTEKKRGVKIKLEEPAA